MIQHPYVLVRRSDGFGDADPVFQRLMNPWQAMLPMANGKWQPNTDVLEASDHILIRMELAGVPRESIHIVYHEGRLVVQGHRKDPVDQQSVHYLQLEIHYNEFEKVIVLPEEVDVDKINAELSEGMLLIRIPRKQTAAIERQIKIKVK